MQHNMNIYAYIREGLARECIKPYRGPTSMVPPLNSRNHWRRGRGRRKDRKRERKGGRGQQRERERGGESLKKNLKRVPKLLFGTMDPSTSLSLSLPPSLFLSLPLLLPLSHWFFFIHIQQDGMVQYHIILYHQLIGTGASFGIVDLNKLFFDI